MTPPTVFVSKPANSAMPWSSWTTMSPVLRSAKERSAPRPLGSLAAEQPVLGDDGEAQAGGDEAVSQVGLGEVELGLRRAVAVDPARPQAREVVGGALAVAPSRPRDDRLVVGADELLELRLGLLQRARGEVGGLRAELDGLVLRDRAEADARPPVERVGDRVGADVEVVGVRVVEGGADVLPVVGERGPDLFLGGDDHRRVLRREV